jgi:hypothetical protein
MAEPMSSTEIEDVLSSIRRLVSEDMRPGNKPKPELAKPEAAKAATKTVVIQPAAAEPADKLILTPALRVIEAAPTPAPMFVATPRRSLYPEATATPAIETVVASLGAAVDASEEIWEDELPEAAYAEAQDWSSFADETLDEIYSPEPEAEGLNAEASNAETAVPGWAQTEAEAEELEDPHARHPEDADFATDLEPDPIWVAAAEASVIAALAEDARAPDPEFANDPEDASDDPYDDETMRFNEDVLRELVRDILREELAGTLGERITRNIRKLVRAEIARALAAQQLS